MARQQHQVIFAALASIACSPALAEPGEPATITVLVDETLFCALLGDSALIDFDSVADGEFIDTQYLDLGIDFNPHADGTPRAQEAPQQPASPPNWMITVRPNSGGGGFEAAFTPPIRVLGFSLGDYQGGSFGPTTVEVLTEDGLSQVLDVGDHIPPSPLQNVFFGLTSTIAIDAIRVEIGSADYVAFDNFVFGSLVGSEPGPSPSLDIKPGSCPNSFNRNSNGVLPVGLLGTDEFDVADVDLSTVVIARTDGIGGSVGPNEGPPGPHTVVADAGTPFEGEPCECHELTGDGAPDLNMKFKTQEMVSALAMGDLPPGALVELELSGLLVDGTPFQATDCVRLVPPGTPPGMMAVHVVHTNGFILPDGWVGVAPPDNALDGGGFGSFVRTFPMGTVVSLSADPTVGESSFLGWWVNGQPASVEHVTTFVVANRASRPDGLGESSQLILDNITILMRGTPLIEARYGTSLESNLVLPTQP